MIKANEMRAITEANGNIAEKEFLRQVNIIEESIKERAEKGANNTFFTYVQGGTPFNNAELYKRLKDCFISNGFRIKKIDTAYDGCGVLREYAKEMIYW